MLKTHHLLALFTGAFVTYGAISGSVENYATILEYDTKFIRNGSIAGHCPSGLPNDAQLYNYLKDPKEYLNLANDGAYAKTVSEMKTLLQQGPKGVEQPTNKQRRRR